MIQLDENTWVDKDEVKAIRPTYMKNPSGERSITNPEGCLILIAGEWHAVKKDAAEVARLLGA